MRYCKANDLDVYYLNERSGECDFVVCKNNKVIQAIQVSYDISADKTRKREVNGLLMAARVTKCENLLLLTDHESDVIEQEGHRMKVQPVYEWCGELEIPFYRAGGYNNQCEEVWPFLKKFYMLGQLIA